MVINLPVVPIPLLKVDGFNVNPGGTYYSVISSNVRLFAGLLNPNYKFIEDSNFPGIGAMNHAEKKIYFNTKMMIEQAYPLVHSLFDYDKNIGLSEYEALYLVGQGVILHEDGHTWDTLNPDEYLKVIKSLPELTGIDENILHYWNNVVDDCYIQRSTIERYNPNKAFSKYNFEDAVRLAEWVFQGPNVYESFFNRSNNTDLNIVLTSFIWARYNNKVPEGYFIPKEFYEEFNSFYFVDNAYERARLSLLFFRKLYDFLLGQPNPKPKPPINPGPGGEPVNQPPVDSPIKQGPGGDPVNPGPVSTSPVKQPSTNGTAVDEPVDEPVDKTFTKPGPSKPGSSHGGGNITREDILNALKEYADKFMRREGQRDSITSLKEIKESIEFGLIPIRKNKNVHDGDPMLLLVEGLHRRFKTTFRNMFYTRNENVYGMKSGKFDFSRTYRSEYTDKVFYKPSEPMRETDLHTCCIVDASGSMSSIFPQVSAVLGSLLFTLQELGSKSEVFIADVKAGQLKSLKDRVTAIDLYALSSNAYNNHFGGGTDLLSSIALSKRRLDSSLSKDKMLLIFTDGSTRNSLAISKLIHKMSSSGIAIVGLGIGLSESDLREYHSMFGIVNGITPYKNMFFGSYLSSDLLSKLPNDLGKFIHKTFMVK